MSSHSLVKNWMHLIWGTLNHQRILDKNVRLKLFEFLKTYSITNAIPTEIINIQPEHVHILISIPPDITVARCVQLLKGGSSRWINENGLVRNFKWQRGYGAFSISSSVVDATKAYINNQDEKHKRGCFTAEYKSWALQYGVWKDETTEAPETKDMDY